MTMKIPQGLQSTASGTQHKRMGVWELLSWYGTGKNSSLFVLIYLQG